MTKEERRQLRQIERELDASDPRLALLMSAGTPPRRTGSGRALLILVDLLALSMVLLAVATGVLVMIFASSLVTVLALSMHVVRGRVRTV